MAELTSQDRLQPSLLDRLIDNDARSSKESLEARVLSRQQLRAAVLRDLSWLFNTSRSEPEPHSQNVDGLAMWRGMTHARQSVINFGLPSFSGETLSSLNTDRIEKGVREAITAYEPRIDPTTLEVELTNEGAGHNNCMRLIIRGKMWNQPVPLELLLAADVDVETGNAHVRDMRA